MGRKADTSDYTDVEIELWNRIREIEGRMFRTKKGLEFKIEIKGNELFVDRRQKSITRASINVAHKKWSENLIALFIFVVFEAVCQKYKIMSERISNNKLIAFLDGISYSAYITHYAFLVGAVNVGILVSDKSIQLVLFVLLVVISTLFVRYIEKGLKGIANKCR